VKIGRANGGTEGSSHAHLHARQKDLVDLIENSLNEIYVFDRETLKFVEVNRAARTNLGYNLEELLELTPLNLKPEYTLETFRKLIAPLCSGERDKLTFETFHRRKDQSTYPVEVHLQAGTYGGRDVISAIILDTTQRRDAEVRQTDLVELIENSLNEIYVFDKESLKFVEVNRAARANLGYDLEELLELTPLDLKPEYTLEAFRNLIAPLCSGERDKIVLETFHRRRDQSTYPVEVHLQPGSYGGRAVVSAIILDITQRRDAERERRELDLQIQHAQKLESLGVLAGGIAHDFNNILTSILGYADLARAKLAPDSKVYSYVDAVTNGARRASELTTQMLAYSGKGTFLLQPLDLNAVIREMGRLLDVSISKNCLLQYDLAADLPAIMADASQIRQIVMNLIVNASEAVGERTSVVSTRTGSMFCDKPYLSDLLPKQELREGQYVYLEVTDTGEGMSEKTRAKIFDPFFSTKFTGRGLGLAATLGIVRDHHGAIRVQSELGKGSTFKVLFPIARQPALLLDTERDASEQWHGSGNVLVVDDDESVRKLTQEMMLRMGFTVIEAADGREGVELFRRHVDDVRLVLLDMTMPHVDGAAAFREMRRIHRDVPVILTSGYDQRTATSKFANEGLVSFIQKPFLYADLVAVVRTVLKA
jgi:PAS domain S-box-containing protein